MKRTNIFNIVPRSDADSELLHRLLDASASLWNELTYERRQRFFDDESVWEAPNYYDQYKHVLGAPTAQQLKRKNDTAWKSFFAVLEENPEKANPPGYWGNEAEGRELRTYIRSDRYSVAWGKRSRLEISVGQKLKAEYDLGYHEQLRLEIAGRPKWEGKQGQLELYYDETTESYRAIQPVTVDSSQKEPQRGGAVAALDIGVNNLVACTVSNGEQYLYHGEKVFEEFRETTERIAYYSSKMSGRRRTSKRIDRLYRKRTNRRNHAQDALVRDLCTRLYENEVADVFVGDLSNVLSTHWSVRVNEKTHNFWAFRRFITRLESVCEEYGISVHEESEADTTRECPACGEKNRTTRNGDVFWCPCGHEGHADLDASKLFLVKQANIEVGPMARPVRFEWDNHDWRSTTDVPLSWTNPKEARTN
ncbi:RNA-guided endonuclease InsQ/TnpB family protein [Halorussus halophilus]|uniref:RNA-guided endonuclease InsQ/TnpB family protein n=1 Tax=Halorussus halophilus TaxID=2650975 RepID=UPI001301302D|nr:RNA-guided endonuclease TnpB family protein [Halorussus halophilus]